MIVRQRFSQIRGNEQPVEVDGSLILLLYLALEMQCDDGDKTSQVCAMIKSQIELYVSKFVAW